MRTLMLLLLPASLILVLFLIIPSLAQWQSFKLRQYQQNVQSSMITLHQSESTYVPSDINYLIYYTRSYDLSTTRIQDIFVIFGLTQYKMDSHFYTQQFEMSLLHKNHSYFTVNVKTVQVTKLFRLGISYLVMASNGKNNIGVQYHSYDSTILTPLNQSVSTATIRQKSFYQTILDSRISGKLVQKKFKVGIVLMGFYQRTDNGLNITLNSQIFNQTSVLIKIGLGYQTRLLKITFSLFLTSEDPSLATNPIQNLLFIQGYNIAITPTQIRHVISRNRNGQTIEGINYFIGISSFYFSRRDTKLNMQIHQTSSLNLQVIYNGQYFDRMDCLLVYVGQKFCISSTWFNYSLNECSITNRCPDGYYTYVDISYTANFCIQCDFRSYQYYFDITSLQCKRAINIYPNQSLSGAAVATIIVPIVAFIIIGGSIGFYFYRRHKIMQRVSNRSQFDLNNLKIVPDINM